MSSLSLANPLGTFHTSVSVYLAVQGASKSLDPDQGFHRLDDVPGSIAEHAHKLRDNFSAARYKGTNLTDYSSLDFKGL